jgi:hypothetical protein
MISTPSTGLVYVHRFLDLLTFSLSEKYRAAGSGVAEGADVGARLRVGTAPDEGGETAEAARPAVATEDGVAAGCVAEECNAAEKASFSRLPAKTIKHMKTTATTATYVFARALFIS